jgi:ubiquinone/menaquinone biosynthesis C-methylase UbiE
VWADLGCGEGLFTTALGQLLSREGSIIYAVDENKQALQKIRAMHGIELRKVVANFEKIELIIHELDGILMANSLHYVKDKITFIKKALQWMKEDGSFIIVEYDTETSNRWVPYPISFDSLRELFSEFGFTAKKIGEEPSLYNRSVIYAAYMVRDSR